MGVLDRFRLDGLTALVTGARRGIGRAIAKALAEAGADIVGVSATLASSGSDVGSDVAAAGRSFAGYACDFSDRKALHSFVEKVKAECAPVDILVNNAGTIYRRPAAEHSDEDWDRVIEVNLSAQFVLAREFGRDMLARGRGKVIFTASILTFQGGITMGIPGTVTALIRPHAAPGRSSDAFHRLPFRPTRALSVTSSHHLRMIFA